MNVPMSLSNGKSIELNNITESGDGYIRFSDGTQICYDSSTNAFVRLVGGDKQDIKYVSSITYFPKAFINNPIIYAYSPMHSEYNAVSLKTNIDIKSDEYASLANSYTEYGYETVRNYQSFTNGFISYYFDGYTGDELRFGQLYYIAIGRWK